MLSQNKAGSGSRSGAKLTGSATPAVIINSIHFKVLIIYNSTKLLVYTTNTDYFVI